ncbi:MAG: dihydroorotate dehydrogenase [Planctomycetes bacterium]|nr:dihydroorotate dehydrogenase [Planctomycetota bacterium]
MADLSTDFAGIELTSPVVLASGTCGYGRELEPFLDLSSIGGIVTKTITPEPRSGTEPQRIVETPAGMLNAIGLQNPGLEGFIRDKWPYLAELDTAVIVNIAAPTAELHGEMAAALSEVDGIAGLEINISSPNMKDGGMLFGCSPTAAAEVVEAVRSATDLPVIAKLTPNVTDIAEIARAVAGAGAHGVSLINTLVGMAVDVEARRPLLANVTGGLSGPAIMPVALAMVWKVRQAVSVPIMGMGGITSATDALQFLIAGASAIQVGTATFVDPRAAVAVIEGIEAYCDRCDIAAVSDLVGSLRV